MHHLDVKFAILKSFPTQADFAIAIREHETKISQVLRGRKKLSSKDAEKWSRALNCDPAVLKPVIQRG